MSRLKKYLIINGFFSACSGLLLMLFSKQIARFMYISLPEILKITGAFLIIFAALVFYSAKNLANKKLIILISVLDLLWVTASVSIIFFNLFNLSVYGKILMALVAFWILFLAYKQIKYNK
jgi:hypothetical protein